MRLSMPPVEPPPLLGRSEAAAHRPPPAAAPFLAQRPVRWVAGLLLVLAAGGLAMLYFVDPDGSRLYPKCVLYQTTGLQCPGCGGLRAAHALLHGELGAAFRLNPLLVLLSPLLAYVFVREVARSALGREWPSPFRRPWMVWGLVGLLLAYMVWRNLPWFSRFFSGGF